MQLASTDMNRSSGKHSVMGVRAHETAFQGTQYGSDQGAGGHAAPVDGWYVPPPSRGNCFRRGLGGTDKALPARSRYLGSSPSKNKGMQLLCNPISPSPVVVASLLAALVQCSHLPAARYGPKTPEYNYRVSPGPNK